MKELHLDPNDERVEVARFGREVEIFLESPVGDFLLKRAVKTADDAKDKLVANAHTLDRDAIRDLQTHIWRGESFQKWLGDAIIAGHAAIELLKEEEHGG